MASLLFVYFNFRHFRSVPRLMLPPSRSCLHFITLRVWWLFMLFCLCVTSFSFIVWPIINGVNDNSMQRNGNERKMAMQRQFIDCDRKPFRYVFRIFSAFRLTLLSQISSKTEWKRKKCSWTINFHCHLIEIKNQLTFYL